jgi:hypothetical protein
MKAVNFTILLITVSLITACASEPPQPVNDPYNDADSQRSRAKQTQDEMARDTAK